MCAVWWGRRRWAAAIAGTVLIMAFALSILPHIAAAQTLPCGTIIDEDGEATPIDDCANPFHADTSFSTIGELRINGVEITEGAEIAVPLGEAVPVSVSFFEDPFFAYVDFYQIRGQDFVWRDGVALGGSDTVRFSETGAYVAVIAVEDSAPVLVRRGWWGRLVSLLLPTARAYYPDYQEVKAIPFTVKDTRSAAPGVLFLPGIQASRLYTKNLLGVEDQLWEPLNNGDVKQLAMTEAGESVRAVYTREVVDKPILSPSVYQEFLNFLASLKNNGTIATYTPFAYDWRYAVDTVAEIGTRYEEGMRSLVAAAEALAARGNGEVVVIAHSNGGLLAKALTRALERRGKGGIVSKIIFIGTPHLGTPKALAALLHGYDQRYGYGWVMSEVTARRVLNNFPAAYGLLPSAPYFGMVRAPVRFAREGGGRLAAWRRAYGREIDTAEELARFVVGEGEGRTLTGALADPAPGNTALMQRAMALHRASLDSWTPPAGAAVYQIVGTGLPTLTRLFYRKRLEGEGIEPLPLFTDEGDKTVLAASAAYATGTTWYMDLQGIKKDKFYRNVEHADLTESSVTQALVAAFITSATPTTPYASTSPFAADSAYDVISAHSPVSLTVTDAQGRVVGVTDARVREEIPGSAYTELAGAKYIVVPARLSYTVTVRGSATGTYTLLIQRLRNGTTRDLWRTGKIRVTPAHTATFSKTPDGAFTPLSLDRNGDGVADAEKKWKKAKRQKKERAHHGHKKERHQKEHHERKKTHRDDDHHHGDNDDDDDDSDDDDHDD